MKKLYKLALGAGATAAVAIPAVAVVSCGKPTNHKDASQANSKNNQNSGSNGGSASVVSSTKPGVEIDYKSVAIDGKTVSVDEVAKASQSDLLKKFKELKIADEKDTDEQFDSNLESYTVKLVDVLASNEEALSTKDTKDLLISIIAYYQDKISLQTKHDLIVMSDFVAEYVHNNHLITKAAQALNYNPKKGDTDFLEKFDAGHADLLKVVSFAGNALEAFPHNIDSSSTQAILDLITSIEMPQLVKDLFPTNNDATMKAWAEVLNSGIIQEIGSLINEAFAQGIGNADFDALKASVATLISKTKNALVEADVRIMSIDARTASAMIDTLNIPALIDVVKNIVTEGVFGINKDLVNEINKLSNSPVLGIISLEVPELASYMPLIKSAVSLVNQLDSGIANVKQEDFEVELHDILSAIPGASLSEEIKGLITKVLYHGFSSASDLIEAIKSIIPQSLWDTKIEFLKTNVSDLVSDLLTKLYNSQEWTLKMDGFVGSLVGSVAYFPSSVGQGIHAVLSKGIFNSSKEEVESFFTSLAPIQKLANSVVTLRGVITTAAKEAGPILDLLSAPLSAFGSITKDEMVTTADGLYSILHTGISSSATDLRKSIEAIFARIETAKVSLPTFVKPLVLAAINGLDSIGIDQAKLLSEWISSLVPKETPVVSSEEFKSVIYAVLAGQNNIDKHNDAVNAAKAAADAKALALENAKKSLSDFLAKKLSGTVSAETLAKKSNEVRAEDIVVPTAPEGFSINVKTLVAIDDKVDITYEVLSNVEGISSTQYNAEIGGFQKSDSNKLTPILFMTELRRKLNAAGITSVNSAFGGNSPQARIITLNYLKSLDSSTNWDAYKETLFGKGGSEKGGFIKFNLNLPDAGITKFFDAADNSNTWFGKWKTDATIQSKFKEFTMKLQAIMDKQ